MDGGVNDGQVDESEPHSRPGKVEEVLSHVQGSGCWHGRTMGVDPAQGTLLGHIGAGLQGHKNH